MINVATVMVINIVLNIVLSRFMEIGGLALAICKFKKKIGPFGLKDISISFIKILISAIIMGVGSKISYEILLDSINDNVVLIIYMEFGVLLYGILSYFMKIKEVYVLITSVKNKFSKKK